VYATDPRTQLSGGIKRRLAPLLDNDRRRIELAYGLLFSLPGTPVVYYGNEIGMGDNIYVGDRSGMRTPMQWSTDRNAGFSRANPERVHASAAAPVNADPVYGYHTVNVESQERQPYSLLKWMRRLIKVRNEQQAFGRGSIEFVETRHSQILAYIRRHGENRILVVANLAGTSQSVELPLGRYSGSLPIEMLGGIPFRRIGAAPYYLSFAPYGFYWFALTTRAKRDVPPMYRGNAATAATSGPPGVAASDARQACSTRAEWHHVNE
jgi:maltose alpha-D-glucosyltransferase/alpha-amylase